MLSLRQSCTCGNECVESTCLDQLLLVFDASIINLSLLFGLLYKLFVLPMCGCHVRHKIKAKMCWKVVEKNRNFRFFECILNAITRSVAVFFPTAAVMLLYFCNYFSCCTSYNNYFFPYSNIIRGVEHLCYNKTINLFSVGNGFSNEQSCRQTATNLKIQNRVGLFSFQKMCPNFPFTCKCTALMS